MPRELFYTQKKVATCREERGKPEASISADIEMVLEKYKWCKLPKNCRKLFRHNTRNCCGSTSKKRSNMQCQCNQGENASAWCYLGPFGCCLLLPQYSTLWAYKYTQGTRQVSCRAPRGNLEIIRTARPGRMPPDAPERTAPSATFWLNCTTRHQRYANQHITTQALRHRT